MKYLLLVCFVLIFNSLQAQQWSRQFEQSYLTSCIKSTITTGSVSSAVANQLCQCTLSKIKQRYPSMASTVGKLNQQEMAIINQQCYDEYNTKKPVSKTLTKSNLDYYPEITEWIIPAKVSQKFTQRGINATNLRNVINSEIRLGGKRKAMALLAIASMFDLLEHNNSAGNFLSARRIITDSEIMNSYGDRSDALEALKARKGNYANAAEFKRIEDQAYITYGDYFDKIQSN